MELQFKKASKKQVKLRIAIEGVSGSGKTYTSLVCAKALANGGKVAVIDTERGSASLYADKFNFDVLVMPSYDLGTYRKAIKMAGEAGYSVIVIDSLSHAWEGEGGVLEQHNAITKRTGNSFTAWGDITPEHRLFVDSILTSPAHIVATMRSKTDFVIEDNGKGKKVVRKVGMAAIQRPGLEYEFTLVADMDTEHNISIGKTRIDMMDKKVRLKPDVDFFRPILEWCNEGEVPAKDEPKTAAIPESNPIESTTEPMLEKTVIETAKELGAVVAEAPAVASEGDYPENVDFVLPGMPMEYYIAFRVQSEKNEYYGNIPTATLSFMYNELSKSLKSEMTDEERVTRTMKQSAIKTLMAYRKAINERGEK